LHSHGAQSIDHDEETVRRGSIGEPARKLHAASGAAHANSLPLMRKRHAQTSFNNYSDRA
jgi:hypothetical protein